MPSPYVNTLAKETGKTVKEIEKLWNQAKQIAADTLGKAEKDFKSEDYQYVIGIVKNMLGMKESLLDPSIFMKSGKSAKDFIRETVVSANFSIGDVEPVIPPEEDKEEEPETVPQNSADVSYFLDSTDETPENDDNELIDSINKAMDEEFESPEE